jgi:hypothetical protein
MGMVISSTSMESTDGSIAVVRIEPYAWFGRGRAAADVLKNLHVVSRLLEPPITQKVTSRTMQDQLHSGVG